MAACAGQYPVSVQTAVKTSAAAGVALSFIQSQGATLRLNGLRPPYSRCHV